MQGMSNRRSCPALANLMATAPPDLPANSLVTVTIYQYAGSAFQDWVDLAWAGALLITLGVLGINILARVLLRRSV